MEEIMKEKVEIPNVFNKALTMRAGKKKIRKTKNNKKKYKGGLVLVSAIGATALGGTFYIAAADYAAFLAAGYVAAGSGLNVFAGGTLLMTAGTVAATTTTAVGTGTAVGAVATGAAGVAMAPLVVAVAATVGFAYLFFGETAEQAIFNMYEGKTQLEKMNVLRERKANTKDLYDFEVEFEKKANEAMKKAEEEALDEAKRDKANQIFNKMTPKDKEKIISNLRIYLTNMEEEEVAKKGDIDFKDLEENYDARRRATIKVEADNNASEADKNAAFDLEQNVLQELTNGRKAKKKWHEPNPYETTYKPNIGTSYNVEHDHKIEPHFLHFAPTPLYTQFNDNLLDSYNNNLQTSPNNMDPAVPVFGAVISLVGLAYLGVRIAKGVINALKNTKEESEEEKEAEREKERAKIAKKEKRKKRAEIAENNKFDPVNKDYSVFRNPYVSSFNQNVSSLNPYVSSLNPNPYDNPNNEMRELYDKFKGGKKIRRTKRKKYNKK
jgi:hypothetical protein